jgi:hypothetical protein
MTTVMLDIETLGTDPDCVILTLGAVKFNPFSEQEPYDALYIKFAVDEQLELGRSIEQGTLDWWNKQDPAIRDEAMSDDGRIPLSECLADLNRFLVGVKDIWAQGPTFDITILENLYKQMLVPRPWNFWQIRDSRTLFGVHGDPRDKNRASAHNALEDAYSQAQAMQTIYKQVGIKPH